MFLDIDGVLATSSSYKKVTKPGLGLPDDSSQLLDMALVQRFNRFAHHVGARVVVSSAWRRWFGVDWFKEKVCPLVEGVTKVRGDDIRWLEISDYMYLHCISQDQIVILGDDHDMEALRSRWVKTAFSGPHPGFTRKHMRKALQILGYENADEISRSLE